MSDIIGAGAGGMGNSGGDAATCFGLAAGHKKYLRKSTKKKQAKMFRL
jgi:hypothetical protein